MPTRHRHPDRPPYRRGLRHWAGGLSIVLVASLSACGGGGDNNDAAAAAPPPNNGNAGTLATCGLPDFAAELLQRVNAHRASGGNCRTAGSFPPSQPLVWNTALEQAAAGHSQDMVARNYFNHTSPDGSSPGDRASAAGYTWRTVGENIAAGYPTVQRVIDGWMASDGHCRNILNPAFRDLGVACVPGATGNTYSNYWTMMLGAQ